MPSNRYTGQALYLAFDGVPLSGDWLNFSFERHADLIDSTPVGQAAFVGTTGKHHAHWRLEIYDKAQGGTTITQALSLGASGPLIFGPLGNAIGQPKFGFTAIVTHVRQQFVHADTVIYVFAGVKSGAMLYDFGDVF